MMSREQDRVVVVGGGVVGSACAHFIRQTGRPVTIIEQGLFGRGCSHGNCGYVSPSHVLPLARPGALWMTLKTLLRRNSPLKVRCRFDPALWRWFYKFGRRCNQRDMLQGGHALKALLFSSRALYDELRQTTLTDVEWQSPGLLFVIRSQRGMDHYAEVDELLRREFDMGAKRIDGPALLELEPALRPGCAGAWHYEIDAHLRPDKLMLAWRRALEAEGVEIREKCTLLDLNVSGGRAHRISTSQGELDAEQIVIATGAWTRQLASLLRCSIPIQPGKGYSLTMPRPARCPRFPMIFEEHRVAITPLTSTYRIGSTMEFAGYNTSLNPARLSLLRDTAALYLHEPLAEPVIESWYGWRPMTPDSLPLVGRVPALENVYVAAGHGMLGVSMSPATGRLIAELISGTTPHVDPRPYAVDRRL
jgi:D-amino-acid dehydrogenase